MGRNAHRDEHEKMMSDLIANQTTIVRNCYKLIPETGLFQHCIRTVFSHEICDPPLCSCFINPMAKWKNGDCAMADEFLRKTYAAPKEKIKVGQQKQRKKK